jgi:tRNA U34 5-carboxymethylaminomethyl modifying enzyme MnmG/GidA
MWYLWVLVTQVLAAAAAANLGSKTLLVTMSLQNIAQMSCNPAMGGMLKDRLFVKLMP